MNKKLTFVICVAAPAVIMFPLYSYLRENHPLIHSLLSVAAAAYVIYLVLREAYRDWMR